MITERQKERARHLFAKEDQLNTELRAINAELALLRSQYMRAERICGLDKFRFRQEILR